MNTPPRLVPGIPWPPYGYVPGRHPHPISDPAGHSHQRHPSAIVWDPERWWDCPTYLLGFDLFNAGFYWEAHEAWETVWQAEGRRGPIADALKGLIHLAAAGVKNRAGIPAGVASHTRRAEALFAAVDADLVRLGLTRHQVDALAAALSAAPLQPAAPGAGPRAVIAPVLVPERPTP